jgi:phage gp29-like protein
MSLVDFIFGRAPAAAVPAANDRIEPPLSKLGSEQATPSTASFARNPYSGHPAAGLTPAALALILRSSIDGSPLRYLELAEDMEERYFQYGSTLSTRKRAVARMDITVEPAGETQADKDEAALVREVIEGAAFRLSLIDMLDAIGKGFSATEIVWDTSAKPWKPVAFKHRDPRFFEFDRVDPERLLLLTDGGREELWPNCWIVHRAKAKSGLPIRGGLARLVAWLYLFQSFTLKDWAIFAEAYGQPLRLGKYDPGASEADKQALLEAVLNIGADFGAIVPSRTAIEFIHAQLTGSLDLYERRADWLDRQCSKIVLGQTGTTDSSEGSGYAQAKVHDDVREDIADSDAEQLGATLTEQLARPLIDFNFAPRKRSGYPKIVVGRPEQEDVKAWVEHVTKLVPFGLQVDQAEAQQKIGVTAPANGAKLLTAPKVTPIAPPAANDDDEKAIAAAAGGHQSAGDDAITDAVNELIAGDGWRPLVEPMVKGLAEEIAEATSVEEVKAILRRRARALSAGELTDALAQLAFGARLAGELGETLRDGD